MGDRGQSGGAGSTVVIDPAGTLPSACQGRREDSMGRKIAIVGAGAVGGYAGAHMVQAGEDVTFIDPWPEHVEHMRKHGLARDARQGRGGIHRARARAACHRRAAARQGEAGRHRLRVHEVVRHGLGDDADPAISGARRLRRLAAELHERGDDRRHRRLGQDARLHRQQHHGQPAGARPYPPRRRQGRGGAHRISRRRGARPHHAAGARRSAAWSATPTAPR